jgi:hypothetical protein
MNQNHIFEIYPILLHILLISSLIGRYYSMNSPLFKMPLGKAKQKICGSSRTCFTTSCESIIIRESVHGGAYL